MSKVDDYGRFHGNPVLILAACYPLQLDRISRTSVSAWLAECCQTPASGGQMAAPCVHYVVDGKEYIQINNFNQRTRTKSKFPAPSADNMTDMARSLGGQLAAACTLVRARSESESYAYSESNANANAETTRASGERNGTHFTEQPYVAGKTLEEWVDTLYVRHPKKTSPSLVAAALLQINSNWESRAKRAGVTTREALFELIESRHIAACGSKRWTGEQRKFTPQLPKWLDDEAYTEDYSLTDNDGYVSATEEMV